MPKTHRKAGLIVIGYFSSLSAATKERLRLSDCWDFFPAFWVGFVVVAGIAANFHGSALSTFDCDVSIDLDAANLNRLAKSLSPLSPTFRH